MVEPGAESAINLDGGGSTTLLHRGHLLNRPYSSQDQPAPASRRVVSALRSCRGADTLDVFVSTGRLPRADWSGHSWARRTSATGPTIGATSRVCIRRSRRPAPALRHLRGRDERQRVRGGRRRGRVRDHERAKPFVFALVCQSSARTRSGKIGANATGLPFNSLAAVERGSDGRTNPMVNAGAIATTSLVPGATADARWQFVEEGCPVRRPGSRPGRRVYARHPRPTTATRARPAAPELRPDLLRAGRRDRPVHAARLAGRERARSRGDGRHPCRRRREPTHRRPRRRRGAAATRSP